MIWELTNGDRINGVSYHLPINGLYIGVIGVITHWSGPITFDQIY